MAVRYRSLADGDGIAFKWESSLDKILTAGNYAVEIEHYGADVGLPIKGCGTEHSIVGTLVVTDSGALGNKQGDRVIGQVLTFTLRESKETSIYTRTYAGGEWSEWCSLARTGMYDEITNADALYSTVTSLASATKELEENLYASIINYNEWKGSNAELSLPNVLADDEFVKMVKSGTLLTFKNTSTTWKRFQFTAASIAAADVKNYSNWKELSGATYSIKQAVDANRVQISTTGENGGVKDILNIAAATTERAGVMSAEDKKKLEELKNDTFIIFNKEMPLVEIGYYSPVGFINTSNAKNTGLVEISGYSKIKYTALIASSAFVVTFFDANRDVLQELSVLGNNEIMTGDIDLTDKMYRNAVYVAISYYDKSLEYKNYEALLYNESSFETRLNSVEKIKKMIPVDYGLKILIFGDSITSCSTMTINELQQTTSYRLLENSNSYTDESGQKVYYSIWPFLMTKYIACSDVRNYAFSGASYKTKERNAGYERQNLEFQIDLALNDRTNPNGVFPTDGEFIPDIVIFALGTNDGIPNDTYESAMAKTIMTADGKSQDVTATLANLDTRNNCEAMRYAFLKVKQAFPLSLCLCILPIQRADMEKPQINEELEKMAKRYSIKIVDGYSELGVVRDLEIWNGFGANLKDGLHPNDKGQKLYTRMVVSAIKNNWIAI